MNYFFLSCFLLFILYLKFYDQFSLATLDNDALVAFVKGSAEFEKFCEKKGVKTYQIKNLFGQIYGAHLGILFYMRKNWHCDEMNLGSDEQNNCEKYQQYLHSLYEYLFIVYAKYILNKRPIFFYKDSNENFDIKFVEVVERLAIIFEAVRKSPIIYQEQVIDLVQFELKNKSILKKLKKIKMVKRERFDFKMDEEEERPEKNKASRVKFDKIMEKMWEKVMEKEKMGKMPKNDEQLALANLSASAQSTASEHDAVNVHDIVWALPKYDLRDVIDDEEFFEFIRRKKFIHILKDNNLKSSNYQEYIHNKYEMNLGLLFLMRKNWNCAKINKNIENECEKMRGYLDILHEYLFRICYGFSALKPLFKRNLPIFYDLQRLDQIKLKILSPNIITLNKVLATMDIISRVFFDDSFETDQNILQKYVSMIVLLNENKLGYNPTPDNGNLMTFQESGVQVAIEGSTVGGESQIYAASFEVLLRRAFDKELEEILQKWTQMASEEKRKLDALKEKEGEEAEIYKQMEKEYSHNFFVILHSPFFNP